MPKKTLKERILTSKLLFVVMLVILAFIVFALSKEILRRHQIDEEIKSMEEEVEGLEKENTELSGLLDYYNTQTFKEKEARKRLGLRKDGEKAVALPTTKKNPVEELETSEEQKGEELSNFQRWWDYFFGAG